MKKTNWKNSRAILLLIVLLLIAALSFSLSSAKLAKRYEYGLKLAMAEHYSFFPGTSHTFTVSRDGYYAFQLWGAYGGDSLNIWNGGQSVYQQGGQGGKVSAVSYFTEGTVLMIFVGGKGSTTDGGFNGGGAGGTDLSPIFNNYFGGGGGGATDVRLSSGTLDDRILVAGGGGGGSGGSLDGDYSGHYPAYGGNGGTEAGNYVGTDGQGEGCGLGASMSDGGEGHQFGGFGYGGDAAYSGGGGGGGYYGGGGSYGSAGGGGGGSSYIGSGFTTDVSAGLPDIMNYMTDSKAGFAIITYLGSYI